MNKTILITGASSGLGRATARLFASQGWTVIAGMRQPEKETEFQDVPNVKLLKLNISDVDQISEAVSQAEQISPVDVLFNNAAYGLMGPFEGTTDQQLIQQINTNFIGTILLTKAFFPYFRKRNSGTIITVTSSTANIPYPFVAVYAATKAALETWTEGMSYEINPFGIQIKTIVPAYMQTNFGSNAQLVSHPDYKIIFEKYLKAMKEDAGAKRDSPEHIADVVYEAATDNKTQLHYTAGDLATAEYQWLREEGIESVIDSMTNRFFANDLN